MAERVRPPDRRAGITHEIGFAPPGFKDTKLIVTFGLDGGRIVEAFCASFRADSSVCSMANDAMILVSHLLQRGEPVDMLAGAMGADTTTGRPTSIVGAILRQAVTLQRELDGQAPVPVVTELLPPDDPREVEAARAAEARLKGYEGEACGECGNFTLTRSGTCMKCDCCGATSGCS